MLASPRADRASSSRPAARCRGHFREVTPMSQWNKRLRRQIRRADRQQQASSMDASLETVAPLTGDDADGAVATATTLDEIGLVAGIQRGGVIGVFVRGRIYTVRADVEQESLLAVGDRVHLVTDTVGRCRIAEVAPRTSKLARVREDRTRRSELGRVEAVLAANVDIAVIVAAAAQPAFHPRLVDRFLVICQYGGIRPILCL